MPSFLPNIPQSTDQLSVSQGNILQNFTILGAIAGNTNASSASINATSGFNWIYLPPQGSTPPLGSAFTAGNIGIYSSANVTSTQNELYISKQNQATTVQIPVTASILSVNSNPGSQSAGWTYLPSGIIMQWKFGNTSGSATTAVTFPISFPSTFIGAWANVIHTSTPNDNNILSTSAFVAGSPASCTLNAVTSSLSTGFICVALGY